jgi:hypothetical protein
MPSKELVDSNMTFCRIMLTETHREVKFHFPDLHLWKSAWVYNSLGTWEFHGPEGFYWYGNADNAYHAREQGWQAYLAHKGKDSPEARAAYEKVSSTARLGE